MIKHFCDQCGQEITPDKKLEASGLDSSARGKHKNILFCVSARSPSPQAPTRADFCLPCVIDAVKTLDKRERVEQA